MQSDDERASLLTGPHPGRGWRALEGLFLAMLSGVIYSFVGVIVKQMQNVHQQQLALCRVVGIFTLSLPQAVYSRQVLFPKEHRLLLVARGICGASGLALCFYAFRYLPLGVANVIIFSAPVFVVIVARVFLKEDCGLLQAVALVMTISGLVLIASPLTASKAMTTYTREYVCGLVAAFGGVCLNTLRFIILRQLKGVHESTVMFTYAWVSVVETAAIAAPIGEFTVVPLCGLQPWLMVGLGVLSYVEQLLLTRAMQFEQAGPVATARAATDIVSAFLWQALLFRDTPDAWSVAGAVLVTCSVVLVGLRKWIFSATPNSKLLRYLGWLKA